MSRRPRYSSLAVALALTACGRAPAPTAATRDAISYLCADGTVVQARYPTVDTAQILYNGRSIRMRIAISADGARYVGGGWQWWTKGLKEGTLSPLQPGEEIASAPGVICAAK